VNPDTGSPYFLDFPLITIRDMVRMHDALREFLGIDHIFLGIGGSLGGQQLLEWTVQKPDLFQHLAVIATNAMHSPWGIAFNETQRMALETDPEWGQKRPDAARKGLMTARAVAMLSYRQYETYSKTQVNKGASAFDFRASSYQQYQGKKLADRFNAYSYWYLSKAMDSHHLARGRNADLISVLNQIQTSVISISIDSDILFPKEEQQFLANHIPNSVYKVIPSLYGHDGFLLEYEALTNILHHYLNSTI
jgi:homoserine O-acetyltransferase